MKHSIFCALALLCVAGTAAAVSPSSHPIPYLYGGPLWAEPDSARDSDGDFGIRLVYGVPFASRPEAAVEVTVFATSFERDVDGKSDYSRGVLVDYVHAIPLAGARGPKIYGLGGLGLIADDARGKSSINPGINLGFGGLLPIGARGWSLRSEIGAVIDFGDGVIPGTDTLLDYQLTAGLQIPLSGFHEAPVSAPPADCAVQVVGGGVRDDCPSDSDQDSVADSADLCPGTPPGATVDATGCQYTESLADSDADGVPDPRDRCPGSASGIQVGRDGCAGPQSVVLEGVVFASGSARLTADSAAVLEAVAATLKGQPSLRVEIAGHTDHVGPTQDNRSLSQARAESVMAYLMKQGIDASRMSAVGYGAERPIADNGTAAGRAQNRRVEFRPLLD